MERIGRRLGVRGDAGEFVGSAAMALTQFVLGAMLLTDATAFASVNSIALAVNAVGVGIVFAWNAYDHYSGTLQRNLGVTA